MSRIENHSLLNIFEFLIPIYFLEKFEPSKTEFNTLLNKIINYLLIYRMKKQIKNFINNSNISDYYKLYLQNNGHKISSYDNDGNFYSLSDTILYKNIPTVIVKYYPKEIGLTPFNVSIILVLMQNMNFLNDSELYIKNQYDILIQKKNQIDPNLHYTQLHKEHSKICEKIKSLIFLKFIKHPNLKYINEILILMNFFDMFKLINKSIYLLTIEEIEKYMSIELSYIIRFCKSEIMDSPLDRQGISSRMYRFIKLVKDYKKSEIIISYSMYSNHIYIQKICEKLQTILNSHSREQIN